MDIGLKLIQAAACGVVALFGALLALSVPTNAQPFPQLPDGRVAVEIFGRRIGLPPSPSSLDRINFLPSWTAMSTFGNTWLTLRQALADPEKARRAFEEEPHWVSVQIVAEVARRDEGRLLEGPPTRCRYRIARRRFPSASTDPEALGHRSLSSLTLRRPRLPIQTRTAISFART